MSAKVATTNYSEKQEPIRTWGHVDHFMLGSTQIGNIDEKGIKFDARGRIYKPVVLGGEYPTLSLVCYLSSQWELWRLTPLLLE
jgi:hypothetical protein